MQPHSNIIEDTFQEEQGLKIIKNSNSINHIGGGGAMGRNITNNIADDFPCLEKHCVYAASEILHSIDDTVSPCDDFYAYSW